MFTSNAPQYYVVQGCW